MAKRDSTSTRRRAAARHSSAAARRLAAEVLAFRDRALRRRARALARAPKRLAGPAAVAPRLVQAAGASGSTGVLIAEGDSWFDYPFHDVLRLLEDEYGYDVQSVAHKGDPLESMAYNAGQLEEFTRALEKLLRDGKVPGAILLSGGGNDVAGDGFAMLLNHARSAQPGLSDAVLTGVIDERLADAYQFILEAYTTIARQRIGRVIPIVIHGYDRPVPDGRGFLGGWGPLPGPWLQPGYAAKGFDDLDANTQSAGRMIDRFNAMVKRVAAMTGFEHVHYLDLRGTLSNGPDYKTWWANELHPSGKGFAAVARKFDAVIASL